MSLPLVTVCGVSGSGKTEVGKSLAQRLGLPYADGDDFHPQANKAKMHAHQPLDDEDREPWLGGIGAWLSRHRNTGGVISCSALRHSYRDRLRSSAPSVRFLLLNGDKDVVQERLARREDHFMPAALLDSQYDALEPLAPHEPGLTVDFAQPVDELVEQCVQWLTADD